jgi:hypothetical protein
VTFVQRILVEDASGAQFEMYEFLVRRRVFGFVRSERRFELDTGEAAERVDENCFGLLTTGERLLQVEPPSSPESED